MKFKQVYLLTLFSFFLFSSTAFATGYEGLVVSLPFVSKNKKYTDGDTVEILFQGQTSRVRLANIDAPEMDQPSGSKAKEFLDSLIAGRVVWVVEHGIDENYVPLVRIYLDELDINKFMLEYGFAWYTNEYSDDAELLTIMEEAKRLKKGIWSFPDQVPPWEWRKRKREKKSSGNTTDFNCGQKRRCWQMGSCEEAMFYLNTCGVTSLDGDRDGVPCEKICRKAEKGM
ncbi:MAG: thermonuclease family protein [Deltaproteobacteria bacterium]|nr:thermonuclease family protein [Deltaproteobacteria bacterium]